MQERLQVSISALVSAPFYPNPLTGIIHSPGQYLLTGGQEELSTVFLRDESCDQGAAPCSFLVLAQAWLQGLHVFNQSLRIWEWKEKQASVFQLSHFPRGFPPFLSQDSENNSSGTNLF